MLRTQFLFDGIYKVSSTESFLIGQRNEIGHYLNVSNKTESESYAFKRIIKTHHNNFATVYFQISVNDTVVYFIVCAGTKQVGRKRCITREKGYRTEKQFCHIWVWRTLRLNSFSDLINDHELALESTQIIAQMS